jgi:hypothetical protein
MKTKLLLVITALCAFAWISAQAETNAQRTADPGKPDQLLMDSVAVKAGQNFEMAISTITDDVTRFDSTDWSGIGSFCIPLKYDYSVIKIDSVKFENVLSQWDEKFTNEKIDTGFISFAGIYTLKGAEKPAIISPDKPMEIIRLYMHINKGSKPGNYTFDLTRDPLQDGLYFGSIDGYHAWKPQYKTGKVVVTK